MRVVDADAVKEALRNRMSESINECIDNIPAVDDKAISLNAVLKIIDEWYDDKADIEDLIVRVTYMPSVSQPQNLDYSIILGIDTDHLNELLDGKIVNTTDVLKGFKNVIDERGLKGLKNWKTNFGGLINILYDAIQGATVLQPQDGDRAISLNAAKDLFCRICMESKLCYRSKETCVDLKLFDKLLDKYKAEIEPQERSK